jgi:hypothetical protein
VLTDFGYNGTWSNQIQLTGVSPQQDDGFGFSASVNTKHLFVGSPLLSLDQDTAQSGAAFTFSVQSEYGILIHGIFYKLQLISKL